jgi:hypothetical protein
MPDDKYTAVLKSTAQASDIILKTSFIFSLILNLVLSGTGLFDRMLSLINSL